MKYDWLEISYCPMVSDAPSASRLAARHGPVDFFDVVLSGYRHDGTVDVLEEYENLTAQDADSVFSQLCARYPNADQNILD